MAAPMATQSQLMLPAAISGSNLNQLKGLAYTRNGLSEHITACYERLTHLADCQATFNESEAVPDLESAVRDLVDMQADSESLRRALMTVADEHASGRVPEDTAKAIFERTEVAKVQYRDLTDVVKYGKNKHFDEFKRRVFAIEHKDEDYPGAESFFTNGNDDDLEMTYHTKRSLKCPITMMTFENPVRSNVCVHVFSRAAIVEMIRRNRGFTDCPVAGCDKTIRVEDLERDRVMERRVRDEEDDELENQGEELSSEIGNEDVFEIL